MRCPRDLEFLKATATLKHFAEGGGRVNEASRSGIFGGIIKKFLFFMNCMRFFSFFTFTIPILQAGSVRDPVTK